MKTIFYCFVREKSTGSQHYSKHSSLLTDLSLSPSPPTSEHQEVNDDNNEDNILEDNINDDDIDSLAANVSHQESSLGSSDDVKHVDDDILTTPLNDDTSLQGLNTPEDDPSSPHYNTPEESQEQEQSSTCPTSAKTITSTTPVQQHQYSFHPDILNLEQNLPPSPLLPPKPSTINNNKTPVTPSGSLGSPGYGPPPYGSPSYCSQSPAYSIPSPGSAFSVVISRRRESE